ncbi:MAG: helix-turn-helix domain-containing protein [Candidatus Bathyarchaeota archaeon]|nr:helix-turn-helix domain-containing protein [Candidatus Bathyarchaeota archaeon]
MADVWRKPYHVVLEVENRQCKVLKKFASLGMKHLKVDDIRSSSNGVVKHLIELDRDQIKKVPKELRKAASRVKTEGKASMWFESEGCEVCNTILSRDAFLISGKSMEEYTIMYSFIVPTFEAYTNIIKALENSGHKVTVVKMGSFEPKTGVLTRKQERIFWLALKSGFFDYPRKVGMREFSTKLGISPATLSEIIRRGTRRLLENYFEKEPT